MIGVIADDLTGAAEIGGVACRYGLRAEVHTAPDQPGNAELIVVDTDSRGCAGAEAARRAGQAAQWLRGSEWIYKKIDSVLRGPVLAALGLNRALVLPGNPSQGRVVRAGRFFVQGRSIDETDFRNDPLYPRWTADVVALAGPAGSDPACLRRPGEVLPAKGIVIGEVESDDDLRTWAARVDEQFLCVGGADFFRVMLETKLRRPGPQFPMPVAQPGRKRVFVCGTASSGKVALMRAAAAHGVPVLPLPQALCCGGAEPASLFEEWSEQILESLARSGSVALVIDHPLIENADHARQASTFLLQGALRTAREGAADQFLVEGGATASEFLKQLGWMQLRFEGELASGVVCLTDISSPLPRVIVKPGSYPWPAEVWNTAGPATGGQ